MNQDINDRLAKYLDKIEGGIDAAIDFGAEQAPLVVQEVIAWELWSGCLWSIASAMVVIVFSWIGIRALKTVKHEETPLGVIGFIVCSAIVGVSSFKSVACCSQVIKATIAPRVVVLEKIGEIGRSR